MTILFKLSLESLTFGGNTFQNGWDMAVLCESNLWPWPDQFVVSPRIFLWSCYIMHPNDDGIVKYNALKQTMIINMYVLCMDKFFSSKVLMSGYLLCMLDLQQVYFLFWAMAYHLVIQIFHALIGKEGFFLVIYFSHLTRFSFVHRMASTAQHSFPLGCVCGWRSIQCAWKPPYQLVFDWQSLVNPPCIVVAK